MNENIYLLACKNSDETVEVQDTYLNLYLCPPPYKNQLKKKKKICFVNVAVDFLLFCCVLLLVLLLASFCPVKSNFALVNVNDFFCLFCFKKESCIDVAIKVDKLFWLPAIYGRHGKYTIWTDQTIIIFDFHCRLPIWCKYIQHKKAAEK